MLLESLDEEIDNEIDNDLDEELITEEEFYRNDVLDVDTIPHKYDDCYLSKKEYDQLQTPSTQRWQDYSVKDNSAKFFLDSSKD